MKANFTIDMYGQLEIERNGEFKSQFCPRSTFSSDDDGGASRGRCGDWCPLFGEVNETKDRDYNEISVLKLCEGQTIEGSCKDERK
jgi:hypothetical protein